MYQNKSFHGCSNKIQKSIEEKKIAIFCKCCVMIGFLQRPNKLGHIVLMKKFVICQTIYFFSKDI